MRLIALHKSTTYSIIRRCSLDVSLSVVLLVLTLSPPQAVATTCSGVILNKTNCTITIDRESPSSPSPTIRLAHGKKATVEVTRRPLESVVFSPTRTDAAKADPLNVIFQNLVNPLKSLVFTTSLKDTPKLAVRLGTPSATLLDKLNEIDKRQKDLWPKMDQMSTDYNSINKQVVDFQNKKDPWDVEFFSGKRAALICAIRSNPETLTAKTQSGGINCTTGAGAVLLNDLTDKKAGLGVRELPLGEIKALDDLVSSAIKDSEAIVPLDDSLRQKLSTVAFNQSQLDDSLKSLQTAQSNLVLVASLLDSLDPTKPTPNDPCPVGKRTCSYEVTEGSLVVAGLDRSLALAISTLDLVSAKSNGALAQINFTWRSTSFEVSTGILISTMANRTFQNSPIIQNGQPVLDTSGKGTTVLTQSITRPTVVPVVLAHYRLKEYAPGGHRIACLLTGGVGVNPYSTSADFGAGMSIALNSVMISPLLHFGRENRLTNGLAIGEKLGGSPPTPTTERFWSYKFAVGLTYTLPIP